MLKTNPIPIRKGILSHLKKQQDAIDALPTYEQQVKYAKALWQSKKKSNSQKSAFKRIEKELQKIAVGGQYCNYCEANKGTNIEHIYPKGLFPNKTFVWENYLWACKQCNGRHKVSQFQIFETPQSAKVLNLVANQQFQRPPNEDAVFINPRVDNPLDYFQLDLETGLFNVLAADNHARAYKRAAYTLDILQLNARKGLVEARQVAYQSYLETLESYINRPNIATQKEIITQAHPTVWKEMQRQAESIALLKDLFLQIPEALYW